MLQFLFAMTLASSAPAANPGIVCLSVRSAVPPEDQSGAYVRCIRDRQAARGQIRQNLAQFPADARRVCAKPDANSASYVEWLSCLENAGRR